MDEVRRLEGLKDKEINEAKKILAFEATKLCRGEEAALNAAETARKTFEDKTGGEDLPTLVVTAAELESGMTLIDAFCALKLTETRGETKRLIAQGGAKVNDIPVSDNVSLTLSDLKDASIKLSAGKKKHALIKLKG